MKTNTKKIGDLGEDLAVKLLKRKHYRIIARNYHAGHYELDIIAKNRTEIVFVEVKTRTVETLDNDFRYGTAASAVDNKKKRNTVDAAFAYLRENRVKLQPRIDVIEVYLDKNEEKPKLLEINHFENAVTRKDL